MSQSNDILRHLQAYGWITPRTALDEYGCFRSAARIAELRKLGHRIETTTLRPGRGSYAKYVLEKRGLLTRAELDEIDFWANMRGR